MDLVTPATGNGVRAHSARRLRGTCAALCLLLAPVLAWAEPTEADVKAAFAFSFLRFTTWPDTAFQGPDSPLVMGVRGAPEMLDRLTTLAAGQTIQGRAVIVRAAPAADLAPGMHALYLGKSSATADIPAAVLTVGDTPGFARRGGIIGLVVVDQRVRFEINLDNAHRSGLQLSSQLLGLAKIVSDSPGAAP